MFKLKRETEICILKLFIENTGRKYTKSDYLVKTKQTNGLKFLDN